MSAIVELLNRLLKLFTKPASDKVKEALNDNKTAIDKAVETGNTSDIESILK